MQPPRRPASTNPTAAHVPQPAKSGDTSSCSPTAAGGRGFANVFPVPPREPQPGDMIGPFRIVRELGRGGMAIVYEADDTELPRRVALKVLTPSNSDPQSKLRFVREAHAQAKISHDHVVTIYRVGEANGMSYIAMPVLTGQTLAEALVNTPRPPVSAVVRIAGEVAEGLAAAHAAGLIHRDIKPSNIWLEAPKWRVKILDFGLARDPNGGSGNEITISGHVVGTPAYMSPEQAAGHPVDFRTDLWSLGVVLYQMTTGQKPFAGENTLNLMTAIISTEPRPPLELAPDLPPALSALIQRLLAKDPDDRPASAAAVVEELDAIARNPNGPRVVVSALPSVVAPAPAAASDPWSNLETTEEDVAPVRKSRASREREREHEREPEEPRRRPVRRASRRDDYDDEDRPRSLKWLWIGGGSALAAILLGGLVWMAVAAVTPKTKTTEPAPVVNREQPKPPPPKPPEPDRSADRTAAEALGPMARLTLLLEGGGVREVAPGGKLPAERFTLQKIDFGENQAVNALYANNTFIPAVVDLKGLTEVIMGRFQMPLSAEAVRRMSAMPFAKVLKRLDAPVELTAESVDDLKKFENINDLTFMVSRPSDALFAKLAALPLDLLAFLDLSASTNLTDKGWGAIAQMPLKGFSLWESPTAGDAFRVLTAKGAFPRTAPLLEFVSCVEINDASLLELSKRETDVKVLYLRSIDVTDAGVMHLAEVKSLKKLYLTKTKVTEEGARALAAARPDMTVSYNGKIVTP